MPHSPYTPAGTQYSCHPAGFTPPLAQQQQQHIPTAPSPLSASMHASRSPQGPAGLHRGAGVPRTGGGSDSACTVHEAGVLYKIAQCFQELRDWKSAVAELESVPKGLRTGTLSANLGHMYRRLGFNKLSIVAYKVQSSAFQTGNCSNPGFKPSRICIAHKDLYLFISHRILMLF